MSSAIAWNVAGATLLLLGSCYTLSACAPRGSLLAQLGEAAPLFLWRAAGAARVQWVARGAAWAFDAFLSRRHPIVQLLYLGVVGGAFGAFAVKGFPELRDAARPNAFFAPRHITEAWALLGACLVTFAAASFCDPGVVTAGNARALAAAYAPDGVLYPAARADCATCALPRPARSKHCPACGHCVARFDHHCIWLNACVGERTYRFFLAFLAANAVLMAYGVWAAGAVLGADILRDQLYAVTFVRAGERVPASHAVVFSYLLGERPAVVMVGVLCAVMGTVVLAFLAYHAALAVSNVTTNETFKRADLEAAYDEALAAWRAARADAAAARAAAAAARARGDAAAAAAADMRAAAAEVRVGPGGVLRPLAPEPPPPLPRHAYDRGWRANLGEVFWPLSLRAAAPRGRKGD
jgi:hypothetical protein